MASKPPDRVYIDESDKEDYKDLLEDSNSPLEGTGNPDVFLLAAVTGFRKGERIELDSKYGWARTEYFDDKAKSVIKAIAVAEEGLDVLLDKKKVYSIAEEYATTGVKLLKNDIFGRKYGTYIKELESDLKDIFESLSKGEP
ncbi:hypothetical protein AKJ58_00635 [candidate division MSBL1 archaeon SCGC-AAA385D11]|uniref:Uncharacterized protein n=1 Tax=candidate division MSBL1 archaeon SCGC-AAA385D11 TaxID=1698286 RepID=A0A133VP73_9EURY|nr:hypothetical protein AKJ58_00635 [candidate division MSBL1 archaeon SCGC-AAA385D11]